MKYIICFFIASTFYSLATAQDKYNIACRDFTFQNKECKTCEDLKLIFEYSISKANSPFKLIERSKMDRIFEAIQEEKNLYKDLSLEFDKKLQLAGVDFLVVGNIDQNIGTGTYSLFINFIKITGKDVTEKLPMLISIPQSDFSNSDALKKIFSEATEAFFKSYFIVKNDNSDLVTVPDFLKELHKRDSVINRLQTDALAKDQTINYLNKSVSSIKDENVQKQKDISDLYKNVSDIKIYTDVAKLGINGFEGEPGYGIIFSSPLNDLMKNVIENKNGTYYIKYTDSALSFANQVIEKFPTFPFGYYSKAMILLSKNKSDPIGSDCVNNAIKIFKITTTISGHNPQHDQALNYLKSILSELNK